MSTGKLIALASGAVAAGGLAILAAGKLTPGHGGGSVASCRASVPTEPGLKATSAMLGGHFYNGQDAAHIAWVKQYLAQKASSETGERRRGILAFAALQGREGSTAAVNTYDNQIFTWGTGWGGLGGLPMVMNRLVSASPNTVAALAACGVRYMGGGSWSIDDGSGGIVTGKAPALQVIRRTPALLNLFIRLAKDTATREAVADAQLGAFLASSGTFSGSETIATQALYNFVAHLKHWAPGFVAGAVESAAAMVPGAPSEARDALLAPAIVQAFYDKAPSGSYVRSGWKQLQGYALRDMKADGLDVGNDLLLTASGPPPRADIGGVGSMIPLAVAAVASGAVGVALSRRAAAKPAYTKVVAAVVTSAPYVTRPEDIVVPPWVRVGDELQTVTPLRDKATGGFARLSYAGALAAARANDGELVSRSGVETRSEAARASNLELSPVTLPDVGVMRSAGVDPKDRGAIGALLNARMRSKEWAKIHDDRVQSQLSARGWDGQSVTSNIGKPWTSGAAPGRGRLFGWRLPNGSWIQPEEDAHDDSWSDYATTTILRRPATALQGTTPHVHVFCPEPEYDVDQAIGDPCDDSAGQPWRSWETDEDRRQRAARVAANCGKGDACPDNLRSACFYCGANAGYAKCCNRQCSICKRPWFGAKAAEVSGIIGTSVLVGIVTALVTAAAGKVIEDRIADRSELAKAKKVIGSIRGAGFDLLPPKAKPSEGWVETAASDAGLLAALSFLGGQRDEVLQELVSAGYGFQKRKSAMTTKHVSGCGCDAPHGFDPGVLALPPDVSDVDAALLIGNDYPLEGIAVTVGVGIVGAIAAALVGSVVTGAIKERSEREAANVVEKLRAVGIDYVDPGASPKKGWIRVNSNDPRLLDALKFLGPQREKVIQDLVAKGFGFQARVRIRFKKSDLRKAGAPTIEQDRAPGPTMTSDLTTRLQNEAAFRKGERAPTTAPHSPPPLDEDRGSIAALTPAPEQSELAFEPASAQEAASTSFQGPPDIEGAFGTTFGLITGGFAAILTTIIGTLAITAALAVGLAVLVAKALKAAGFELVRPGSQPSEGFSVVPATDPRLLSALAFMDENRDKFIAGLYERGWRIAMAEPVSAEVNIQGHAPMIAAAAAGTVLLAAGGLYARNKSADLNESRIEQKLLQQDIFLVAPKDENDAAKKVGTGKFEWVLTSDPAVVKAYDEFAREATGAPSDSLIARAMMMGYSKDGRLTLSNMLGKGYRLMRLVNKPIVSGEGDVTAESAAASDAYAVAQVSGGFEATPQVEGAGTVAAVVGGGLIAGALAAIALTRTASAAVPVTMPPPPPPPPPPPGPPPVAPAPAPARASAKVTATTNLQRLKDELAVMLADPSKVDPGTLQAKLAEVAAAEKQAASVSGVSATTASLIAFASGAIVGSGATALVGKLSAQQRDVPTIAPEPPPPVAPPPAPPSRTYTVKPGDSPFRIALAFNATKRDWWKELSTANPQKKTRGIPKGWEQLLPGEVVIIPREWPEKMATVEGSLLGAAWTVLGAKEPDDIDKALASGSDVADMATGVLQAFQSGKRLVDRNMVKEDPKCRATVRAWLEKHSWIARIWGSELRALAPLAGVSEDDRESFADGYVDELFRQRELSGSAAESCEPSPEEDRAVLGAMMADVGLSKDEEQNVYTAASRSAGTLLDLYAPGAGQGATQAADSFAKLFTGKDWSGKKPSGKKPRKGKDSACKSDLREAQAALQAEKGLRQEWVSRHSILAALTSPDLRRLSGL